MNSCQVPIYITWVECGKCSNFIFVRLDKQMDLVGTSPTQLPNLLFRKLERDKDSEVIFVIVFLQMEADWSFLS